MSLKQKTISGLFWSFIESFANLGITFIAGIILARILSPREFGLIGMITIFIAISDSFINSGFSQALIRKKDCTNTDYSTVFYFNLIVGVLFFLILYFSAPFIAAFFEEPALQPIVQVLGTVLIINAFTLIQRTILTKRINFKLQAKISVISSTGSGIIAIIMAYNGFGVWSLVVQKMSKQMLDAVFLWIWNKWLPIFIFSLKSFKELFGFGSKLLISGLIDTIYRNIYYLVIGKYFSAQQLGYFTRADQFKNLPSQNLTVVIQKVTYPVLSDLQDNKEKLKTNYRKLIRSTMFITFVLMLGLAAVAEPLIINLIGPKWEPAVTYLQLLCFVGMFYPLHALNLNMLMVQGRSDLFLKLEVIKKILAVPVIIIGIIWGIDKMIMAMIGNTIIAYYLNSYWSGQFIGYPITQQVKDILPSFLIASAMSGLLFMINNFIISNSPWKLILLIFLGAAVIILFGEITNSKDYLYLRNILLDKMTIFKRSDKTLTQNI